MDILSPKTLKLLRDPAVSEGDVEAGGQLHRATDHGRNSGRQACDDQEGRLTAAHTSVRERLQALEAKWREKEKTLCRRADAQGMTRYAETLGTQAQQLGDCADELRDVLAARPSEPPQDPAQPLSELHPDAETHWRSMAFAEDKVFGFTNREMRVMFLELDKLRAQLKADPPAVTGGSHATGSGGLRR